MKSIEAARKRVAASSPSQAGDRWRLKMECTSGGSNKNYQITGGPGWTVRKCWGRIGGSKTSKLEPGWTFWDALSFFRDKMYASDYSDIEVTQPTSIIPEVVQASAPVSVEAAELTAAIDFTNETTTTNAHPGGYLTASRRAAIRALWLKKNGKSKPKSKVPKIGHLISKVGAEISDRFAMLELDLEPRPVKVVKKDKPEISARFAMLEFD